MAIAIILSCAGSQMAFVVIKDDGVSVRWEDKSKSLQSSVWLSSEVTPPCSHAPSISGNLPVSFAVPVPDNHLVLMSCVLQLFTHYSCPWVRRAFGLHFGHFVDMLNVFALSTGAELVLRFPGPDNELICEYACFSC